MRKIIVIAHNLRSAHNVGSLLRTAEGLGVEKLYLGGYSPYPLAPGDTRLPHLAQKTDRQIAKTALGAERTLGWQHTPDIFPLIEGLRREGYEVIALEQSSNATEMPAYAPPAKVAVVVGREVEGLEPEVLDACDRIVEIPMFGNKESFNVVQAAAMALYHCRFA